MWQQPRCIIGMPECKVGQLSELLQVYNTNVRFLSVSDYMVVCWAKRASTNVCIEYAVQFSTTFMCAKPKVIMWVQTAQDK